MRTNLLTVGVGMCILGVMALLMGNSAWWFPWALIALGVALVPAHVIRHKRYKRPDLLRMFD